jgi:apolipoprotein N-acyltransferase
VTAVRSLAHRVILAWGWRRAAIACAAGAASALAMAPLNAWPVLVLTFPVAVWLIDATPSDRFRGSVAAALAGWWFGFGYFVAGLYWTGNALLVDAATFAWLLPFAIFGLPALLAVFMALGFALAKLIWSGGPARILSFAVAITASEWLRGHVLSGFPWNAPGYALASPLALAQAASLVGLWGLTFLTLAIFASPAVLADTRATTRRPWLAPGMALTVLAALALYGAMRLAGEPTRFVEGVRLRLMQPNLPQDAKFNYGARREVMRRYLSLSERSTGPNSGGLRDITFLIWPESAFPFFLSREPEALAQIADLLPQGTMLITGAVRPPDTARPGQPVTRAYNSIYVIDHDGTILSVYDKLHLVPFGEYLPFQSTLERIGLTQLTKVQGGFIAGTRRRPIELPRAPAMLPLICYEAIFPGDIVSAGERPGWIVNLTNDGWFGASSGPYQHLQQTRLRAIEEGLPIVRVANTGVSAVIDPLGRIVTRLDLGVESVADANLPASIAPTLYSRAGDTPAALMLVAALALVFRLRSRRNDETVNFQP